ncbi:hypothetical protein scyTo_0022870, partial [Scyliorhinus torazame]|nr:hypothetical protein [Scyliorhinus torazame]
DSLMPEHGDPLHELLKDLGDIPTVESLLGEGSVDANDPHADQTLSQLNKTEVSLTLTNKFDLDKSDDGANNTRGLLLRQQRKAELNKLRATLHRMDSKTAFYEEQIDYYQQYIRTCLDNLATKAPGPGKKAAEVKGKKRKVPSLNYTAARLQEKGVLLDIEDLPGSQ